MTTFISDYYDDLEDTLTQIKSLKLKSYPGENITDCYTVILVDAERLESALAFKPEKLGHINLIFEDTSDFIFHLWEIHKYKEITEFIKKLCVCDMYVISPERLIIYYYLVQEATYRYRDLVNSKWWEPATGK